MTPTPISSDIPNKVCVAPALAETDAENTAELSQDRPGRGGAREGRGEKKRSVRREGGGSGGIGGMGEEEVVVVGRSGGRGGHHGAENM